MTDKSYNQSTMSIMTFVQRFQFSLSILLNKICYLKYRSSANTLYDSVDELNGFIISVVL